jgi:nitrilase
VEHIEDYIANSLVVGSPEWDVIVNATKLAGIHVALAFSERIDDNIYMGQTLLGPNGTTLLHRQKLRPTGSERDIFSDGYVEGLAVANTSIGRITMLQCWEHLKVRIMIG